MASSRFRRLTDLFVTGVCVDLPDGNHIWVQALNSYQRDECVSDAQVARSRLVMALREKGDERLKIEGRFYENGRDAMIEDLATHRATSSMGKYIDDMRADPDWKERMEMLMRTDEADTAKPLTIEEMALLAKINQEIMDELAKREADEVDFVKHKMAGLDDSDVIDEWTEDWLENKGGEIAQGEYRLTEIWYATRWCNAALDTDGKRDHSTCDHESKVFENRTDVRDVGDEFMAIIHAALAELNLVGNDPKDSARAASSSSSPPMPSAAEESQPSTSTPIQDVVPGI